MLGYGVQHFNTILFATNTFTPKALTKEILSPLFKTIVRAYKKMYDMDLSYMKIDVSDKPINTDGKINISIPIETFGGCHTHTGYIYINTHFELAVKHYEGTCTKDVYIRMLKLVIAHELAHEVWMSCATDAFKSAIEEALDIEKFETAYTKSLDSTYSKYKEEQFCEYLATKIYTSVKSVTVHV